MESLLILSELFLNARKKFFPRAVCLCFRSADAHIKGGIKRDERR